MLAAAVQGSSTGCVAIRYVLPVLWMTSFFSHNGPVARHFQLISSLVFNRLYSFYLTAFHRREHTVSPRDILLRLIRAASCELFNKRLCSKEHSGSSVDSIMLDFGLLLKKR